MKCPVCGTDNKSTNKACYRCSHTLQDDGGVKPKGKPNSLWYNARDQKRAQNPPPFWGDAKGKPVYEDKGNFVVLEDEHAHADDDTHPMHGVPTPNLRSKLRAVGNGQEVTVVLPPEKRRKRAAQSNRRYRVNWTRFALTTMVLLVLTAGVTYGAVMAYRYGLSSVSHWFESRQGNEPAQDPLVEKVMINGDSWHRVTFFGKDGEQVLVTEPRWSKPIIDGKAVLLLDDQSYIPDEMSSDQGKVTVELMATIFTPDNKEKKITVPSYTIEVPLSPLKVVAPEKQSIETTGNRVTIKVKVTPGSRVKIASENVTDNVNKEGFVSSTAKVEPVGLNEIVITVETKKHRKNTYVLKVNRPIMDVPISLDKDTKDKTPDNIILIKGTTQPGATLTTDATLKGSLSQDKSTGAFHFNAKLTRWGWNAITLTATKPDGTSSTMTQMVDHTPALESYTKSAQVVDFGYLTGSAENMIGRVFAFEGQVIKKLDSDTADYYLFNLGTASEAKLIALEYTKESGLTPGKYYRVFADVSGVFQSYPVLTARFIYEEDIPASFGTPEPGSTVTSEATASAGATASPGASPSATATTKN